MFEGYAFYAIVTFMVFAIVLLGVTQATTRIRTGIVSGFLIFLPVTYFATVDLMSRPRPVKLMLEFMRPDPEVAKVLAVYMVEDEYIMLLLNWDGLSYPRYFKWDWDQEMAEQLTEAQNGARGEDGEEGEIEMQLPFDSSLERRQFPWAHPVPQTQTIPPKNPVPPNVYQFNREGT